METIATGTLISGRFEIEDLAGRGGMGSVYRAFDRQRREEVALKVLHPRAGEGDTTRFAREARILAELRHPGIVSYVAQGETADGAAFLAMEWLPGEDLKRRLERGRMAISEAMTLLWRTAEALAAAHRRGIVHRDIKPSNLFLRDGRADRVTILDFGVARRGVDADPITRTGVSVGTPRYMAPEQARGEREIGPGADVFALGCVLYECLIGAPPFGADRVEAVLAQVLFEAAADVRSQRAEVPARIAALVSSMLEKSPSARPRDAMALLAHAALLGAIAPDDAPAAFGDGSSGPEEDGGLEQQLVSVVVALPRDALAPAARGPDLDHAPRADPRDATLDAALRDLRARVAWSADGSLIAALALWESAFDLATQAAHCALIVQERMPDARVALAIGRGVIHKGSVSGEAAIRAARMARGPIEGDAPGDPAPGIWIDQLSEELLAQRFSLARGPHGTSLHGERPHADGTRLLLGKPTPCVGRELEIRLLDATLTRTVEEEEAEAVLVTAPPGFGKSRLRHELVRRLEARGERVEILIGRADAASDGALYGPLAQALRSLCGARRGDAAVVQAASLRRCLGERIEAPDAVRIVDFLVEMCGVGQGSDPSALVRAARNDPKLMSDQITRAVVDWLRAECARRPVLLILEDLHWGDALTVGVVDAALRDLRRQPFMVLALARPEVKDLFPAIWSARGLREVSLTGLSRKASERLVRDVLGEEARGEVVDRIVAQAAGNALYLEELTRAAAEGRGDALPGTVLSMLQARLSGLAPGARRVLRAASVLGASFWRGGVHAVHGEDRRATEIDGWLEVLADLEIIEPRPESRFPSEREYRFRHALMRDAAHSMLTADDRAAGHRIASAYLESVGEQDPMVLGDHAELGGDLDRAVVFYVRATEQAFAHNDWKAIELRAARGVASGARRSVLGKLRTMQAWACHYRSELRRTYLFATEALELLPRGSLDWMRALSVLVAVTPLVGKMDQFMELMMLVLTSEPAEEARLAYVEAATLLCVMFSTAGQRAPAKAALDRVESVGDQAVDDDVVRGFVSYARCFYLFYAGADPWRCCAESEASMRAFMAAGDLRNVSIPWMVHGHSQAELGDPSAGERTLREGLELTQRRGEPIMQASMKANLALLLMRQKDPTRVAEARQLAVEVMADQGAGPALLGLARGVISRALLIAGDARGALEEAQKALEILSQMPPLQSLALSTSMGALLAEGRLADARRVAAEVIALVEGLGGMGQMDIELRLAAAETLQAAGDPAGAEAAIAGALREIRIRADTIVDPMVRERFLRRVPDNARVLDLARASHRDATLAP